MCPQGDPAPVLRLVRRDESRPVQPTLEALNAPDQATRPDQKGGCCDRVLWLCVVFWTVAAAGLRRAGCRVTFTVHDSSMHDGVCGDYSVAGSDVRRCLFAASLAPMLCLLLTISFHFISGFGEGPVRCRVHRGGRRVDVLGGR